MIGLGMRLTLRGGREAAARLAVITAAVALGAGLLLVTLAGINATNAQNARYAWLATGSGNTAATVSAPTRDPLWWLANLDFFGSQMIGRIDVAGTGPTSPVPPGIPHLPGPGQYYASPALSTLLRTTPPGELGDRFPGHQVGTIGPPALPSPDSLIIVIGHTVSQLSRVPNAQKVIRIQAITPSSCDNCDAGTNASGVDLILSVAAAALILPVLIFIGTATRLAAARREQRFAAMRLVGATPRQVSLIAAAESGVAAVAGTAAGFGLFFLLRPVIAPIPFTGAPFYPSDISLRLADILPVALGIPVAAAVAAMLALRRVHISPLGVTRRVTPRPPSAYRLIPLGAGIVELASFVNRRPPSTAGQVQAYLPGFVLVMVGLVVAGPWLTMTGSRVIAQRAGRPATLIAGRRLSDDPRAGFRAISGLVLALFVTSVAVGVMGTISAAQAGPGRGMAAGNVLIDDNFAPSGGRAVPDHVLAAVRAIRGVQAAVVLHAYSLGPLPQSPGGPVSVQHGKPPTLTPAEALCAAVGCSQTSPNPDAPAYVSVVSCRQMPPTAALGRCAPGALVAAVPADFNLQGGGTGRAVAVAAWPSVAVSPARLRGLPVQSIDIATDGSAPAIERARTDLELAAPYTGAPQTLADLNATSELAQWQQLADVVILVSLAIAGCSLAVSVAAGLTDRKRPFSLLRLSGVPLGTLRRVVALETTVPLLAGAAAATGIGFLAAKLFLSSQFHYELRLPGAEYYLIVAAGLAVSLGIIASTLPLLDRITGPQTARNE
jgi:hypothetical protein